MSVDSALLNLQKALKDACEALEGPLNQERIDSLQDSNKLPNKQSSLIASQTVDLLDRVSRLVQPPVSVLAESYLAYYDTKCLWAAVENDIPDHLENGPRTVEELAALSSLQPLRLRQILRVLHNNSIFTYNAADDTYANSPASALLVKSHWTQWHTWTDLYGNEFYDMARGIPLAIRAGEARSAAQVEYNTTKSIFHYFAEKGLVAKLHRTLGSGAIAQAPGMIADYDWAEVGDAHVLDIGAGGGDFLASLLRAHPSMTGAILELESVVELVKPMFDGPDGKFKDLSGRVTHFHIGDFTKEVPANSIYTMKWCLHDWKDEDVVRILKNVRKAIVMEPLSRLVVIESVLQEGRSGRIARYGDITMMVGANGQERTENDWRRLAELSGWAIKSVSPLRNAWPAAIDLRPI
ncbi:S-adenosyl-L-methionine-dependent methyltransferase [Corynespora cassiicola Philippines]|uniref:S-adenosyl-L-methionine-dependent methyltransferase n=1 Tax=Corynespora cassiicola Philippines TaxID=1448308 RepID=A0A2T2NNJ8_CORCC|nr:S-adenosyl-L-methionine-dependent methyltransferase [Corynespora cassiicola Philippines]